MNVGIVFDQIDYLQKYLKEITIPTVIERFNVFLYIWHFHQVNYCL